MLFIAIERKLERKYINSFNYKYYLKFLFGSINSHFSSSNFYRKTLFWILNFRVIKSTFKKIHFQTQLHQVSVWTPPPPISKWEEKQIVIVETFTPKECNLKTLLGCARAFQTSQLICLSLVKKKLFVHWAYFYLWLL